MIATKTNENQYNLERIVVNKEAYSKVHKTIMWPPDLNIFGEKKGKNHHGKRAICVTIVNVS